MKKKKKTKRQKTEKDQDTSDKVTISAKQFEDMMQMLK